MKESVFKDFNQLKEYVELEGSELGEVGHLMLEIFNYTSYISEEFHDALVKEMRAQLKNFKDNCRIVTREIPCTQTVKELEWD
jgi:hypothetical protein